jgi:hypothetical protein
MKPARLFIDFGGMARLRPIEDDGWSLYWRSDFGDTAIALVWPNAVEIAAIARREWRHIVINADGSIRARRLDRAGLQGLLRRLLRFTDREFALKAIEDWELELNGPEAEALGMSLSGALPIGEVEMIYGEYALMHISAGWGLVGYNRDVDAAVGVAFRPDSVYANYTHGKKAIFLVASRDGQVEVVEAPE